MTITEINEKINQLNVEILQLEKELAKECSFGFAFEYFSNQILILEDIVDRLTIDKKELYFQSLRKS